MNTRTVTFSKIDGTTQEEDMKRSLALLDVTTDPNYDAKLRFRRKWGWGVVLITGHPITKLPRLTVGRKPVSLSASWLLWFFHIQKASKR